MLGYNRLRLSLWVTSSLGLLIAMITLSERYFMKIDLSDGAQYTLSPEVTDPLQELRDPLVVNAFLPLSAPPPYREIARHTRDLLRELDSASVYISLRVSDSAESLSVAALEELTQRAAELGVETAQLSAERAGRRALLQIPYGVSLARMNHRVVTPPVERLQDVEYQLARATRRLLELRPPQRIGLAQGSGEPDLLNSPLAKRLEAEGTLVPINLDGESIEDEVDLLLLLGATQSYGERARWVIDRLLCDGGSVVIALDHRQQSELFTKVWSPRPTGLEPLLKRYGVEVKRQWVIADPEHPAPAPLLRDAHDQVVFTPHPLYPMTKSSLHPITVALSELVVPMSPLFNLPDQAIVLAHSEPSAVALKSLKSLTISEAEESLSAPQGFPVAFALEMTLESCLKRPHQAGVESKHLPSSPDGLEESEEMRAGRGKARLVMIGSGRRLLSASPKGLEFVMNSLAWARGDESLLRLKQRRVT